MQHAACNRSLVWAVQCAELFACMLRRPAAHGDDHALALTDNDPGRPSAQIPGHNSSARTLTHAWRTHAAQGNITTWKKKEGDQVAPGQVLAEVETDKATIDWESQEDGYIAKILVPDGSKDIAVGAPVAVLVEEAGEVAAFKDYTPGGE